MFLGTKSVSKWSSSPASARLADPTVQPGRIFCPFEVKECPRSVKKRAKLPIRPRVPRTCHINILEAGHSVWL